MQSYDKMKKHLFRVKQLADQTVGRAEKTEVLTEDLVTTEKRVKLLEQSCGTTCKKLSQMLSYHQGSEKDPEKRLRKLPEWQVSCQLQENGSLLADGLGLLANMYQLCGEGYSGLAKERMLGEMEVESQVLMPFSEFLEVDFPNIAKLKKHLNKLTLDMDAVKTRYQSTARQTTQIAPNNMAAHQQKVDQLKLEQEEAQARVEQSKDNLATELYKLCSRQAEFGRLLVKSVELQREYHTRALKSLEDLMPKLQHWEGMFLQKPVYDVLLEDHLKATNREIAEVIEECVCAILDLGVSEEGLFRIAGSAAKIKKLRAEFDSGTPDLTDYDIHCVCGALKLYLRILPEPLLTFTHYDEWMNANRLEDPDKRLQALWTVCNKLPRCNYNNFKYLIKFLAKVAAESDLNKMTPSNIAIVFGPNLIYADNNDGMNVHTSGQQSLIIETFISHADWFFPGDIKFRVTPESVREARKGPVVPLESPPVDVKGHTRQPSQDSFGNPVESAAKRPSEEGRAKKAPPPVPNRPQLPDRQKDKSSLERHQQPCAGGDEGAEISNVSDTKQRPLLLSEPPAGHSQRPFVPAQPDLIQFIDQGVGHDRPPIPERLSPSERHAPPPPSTSAEESPDHRSPPVWKLQQLGGPPSQAPPAVPQQYRHQ
ncbi:PREDICTED: rho GTPase-activating protein 44-like isoform X2 [Priapulus caudatus]|uniref:Rho GTPase-activating protein 44-like isoform X2 n=1 Tax=Priapulus caudatus TaxID=37621 RepID=A0ABM1FB18_PRICU|nr:PREDICTED: rho GTPase-activating protein 44-like isoform X2 [Priapulus caudatus]